MEVKMLMNGVTVVLWIFGVFDIFGCKGRSKPRGPKMRQKILFCLYASTNLFHKTLRSVVNKWL